MRGCPLLLALALALPLLACRKPEPEADTSSSSDVTPPASAPSAAPPPPPAASSPAGASAAAGVEGGPTFADGDTWVGSYSCKGNAGATSLQLSISRGVPAISAVFSFATRAKRSGAFNMSGGYDAATRQLTLTPGAWIKRPAGFVPVGLSGRLSADGQTLSGSVTGAPGCTSFTVHRGADATGVAPQSTK